MATQWLRRGWLLAACASVLLAACGGGGSNVESQFRPDRVVAFGDGFGDVGQNGSRYTVNDGSLNNWTEYVAREYDLGLQPVSAGGTSYARGNARVAAKPDAAGNPATLTVAEQVDAFLATGTATAQDLVMFSAGTADVVALASAVINGAQTRDEALAAIAQAGRDYGAQVRRILGAGVTRVLVAGTYNLGRSPWAKQTGQDDLMEELSSRFNEQFLVSVVDLGENVLYVDAALFVNLLEGTRSSYELENVDDPACTSVDPGPGIGTGAGEVNSNLCTPATTRTDPGYERFLFADRVYLTPRGQQLFGDYAHGRIRERF